MPTLYIADAERDADMKNLSRKEAAKVLEDMKSKGEIPKAAVTQWKRNTALDMAIEALKYSEVPNSSDCISRQAAIDGIEKRQMNIMRSTVLLDQMRFDGLADALDIIKLLPTAQPEQRWIPWTGKCDLMDNEEVLVCQDDGQIRHAMYDDFYDKKKFVTWEEGMSIPYVVAYMPMPEPYKGKE